MARHYGVQEGQEAGLAGVAGHWGLGWEGGVQRRSSWGRARASAAALARRGAAGTRTRSKGKGHFRRLWSRGHRGLEVALWAGAGACAMRSAAPARARARQPPPARGAAFGVRKHAHTHTGGKGRTLLAECPGALLQFFDTPGACALRLVCREFQAAVAAHPWEDRETVIQGSIGGWRACFPRARCANVNKCRRHAPVVDADFVHFVGLWELNMASCRGVTDAAFVHLRGIRVLDMSLCWQPTITDAGLAHLVNIQKLSIAGCDQATLTDAAFAPLRGIRMLNMSRCPQFTDAAFAHLKGIHTLLMLYCNQPTITDAALAHLKGIKCLVLHSCSIPFTEVGLVHLRGITRLHMAGANAASIAAARDLGLPVTTGECLWAQFTAFRFSDAESGPLPAGVGWV